MAYAHFIQQLLSGLFLPGGDRALRKLYFSRSQTAPIQGNRTTVIMVLMVALLILLILAALNVDLNLFHNLSFSFATDEPSITRSQFGFVARHIMAVMVIILFLFIDGSPETLGLGLFLAFESLATAIAWNWLPFEKSAFLTHYFYMMGDIFRLYFILQLARLAPKPVDGWLFIGSLLAVGYGLSKQFFPADLLLLNETIRIGREMTVGLLSVLICCRTAFAIRGDRLSWRVAALLVAALASSEVLLNHSRLYLPLEMHQSEWLRLTRDGLRNASYYLFATSAFINVSTMENRIRSLSKAEAEHTIEKYRQERKVHEAISKTTQMFAHDVRRPFSLLKAGVAMLETSRSPQEFAQITQQLQRQVNSAISSVDSMISDIRDLGSQKHMTLGHHNPTDILLNSLVSSFQSQGAPDFLLEFELRHHSKTKVDFHRISRALQNIIDNAIEASPPPREGASPKITLHTDHIYQGEDIFVEINITNYGTTIPKDKSETVFEAFYTSGKKRGTGLGLAVVKSLVESHGGKVSCRSTAHRSTTFTVILPASSELLDAADTRPDRLPKCTSELLQMVNDQPDDNAPSPEELKGANWKVLETAAHLQQSTPDKMPLLIVEDEPLYADALKKQLESLGNLTSVITIDHVTNRSEIDPQTPYALVICDLDLGQSDHDGTDILHHLQSRHPKATYCLHTNRMGIELEQTPLLPQTQLVNKPLSSETLLELVDLAMQRFAHDRGLERQRHAAKARVVLLEDDIFLAEAFVKYMADANVTAFENPSRFLQVLHQRPEDFQDTAAIFVDYHFDNEPELNGTKIAEQLKELVPKAKLILFTDAPQFHHAEPPEPFHLVIRKELMTWEQVNRNFSA